MGQDGIDCRVISMSTLKPLDEDAVVRAAQETGAIVTVEEHQVRGGLGSAVALVVAERSPVPMAYVGIKDVYSKSAKPDELLESHGLTPANVEKVARSLLKRKSAAG